MPLLNEKTCHKLIIFGVICIFIEPLKNLFVFPFLGFYLNISELGLAVFAVGYFSSGPDLSKGVGKAITVLSWVTLLVILTSEAFKYFDFGHGLISIIRVNRIQFPGLAALLILGLGYRPGARSIVPAIFVGIMVSSGLALTFGILGIRPTNPFVNLSVTDLALQENSGATGRFGGNLASLGVLAILLIYFYGSSRRSFTISSNWRMVTLAATILTIAIMAASFNRTLLLASIITLSFVLIFHFRIKAFLMGIISTFVIFLTALSLMQINEGVARQVDKRIAIIFEGKEAILESVYYGNREHIYEQAIESISQHWLLGLPYGEPIFVAYRGISPTPFFYTDISFFNVFARYGILAGFLFLNLIILLIYNAYRMRNVFPMAELNMLSKTMLYGWPIYVLISFNYDVFLRHPPVLFFILVTLHLGFYEQHLSRHYSKQRY